MSRKRGVQWLYFVVTLVGFLCIFFATILPYWYAKYPSANTRFLRLGFWEICLKDFIATSSQQKVYNGCFYIFDQRIRPLWPHIFSAWFITSQLMHTVALVAFIIVMGICVAWLLNVADPYRRDLVMASLVGLAFIAWLLLTVLGVFGVNTDLERKTFRRRGQSAWLSDLDQCSLSWCYGLAALSLLSALVSLNILLWCVYPRKEVGGRLSKFAWRWPGANDLPCCLKSPQYPTVHSDIIRTSAAVAQPSVFARPTTGSLRASQRQRQPLLFEPPPQARSSPPPESLRSSRRVDSLPVSITSSYDPRPVDSVSEFGPKETLCSIEEDRADPDWSHIHWQEYSKDDWSMLKQDPRRYIDQNLSVLSRRSMRRPLITSDYNTGLQLARSMHEPRRSKRKKTSGSSSTVNTNTIRSTEERAGPSSLASREHENVTCASPTTIVARPFVYH